MEQKSVIIVELHEDQQGPVDGLFLTVESMLKYFSEYYKHYTMEFAERNFSWEDNKYWPVLDQIKYQLDKGGIGYWKARGVIRREGHRDLEVTFAISVRHLH